MIRGARIIKTGIAVTITMFICKYLNLEPVLFGAVSAVINLQPSIRLTFKAAREQIIVHFLGISIAFAIGLTIGTSPLTMGLVAMIIIWLYSRLHLQQGVLMGIVAAIFVMSSAPEQFVSHAVIRTEVIFIGLIVALAVNVLLFRPRYLNTLTEKVDQVNRDSVEFFVTTIKAFANSDNEYFEECREKRESNLDLIDECQKLANLYIHEEFPFRNSGNESKTPRIIRFIEYNREMADRTWEICEIMKTRNKRRTEHGNLPLSKEYQGILDMLVSSCNTIEGVNEKLRLSICDGLSAKPELISENLWEHLKEAIEHWQNKNTGSYYLHALLDLSVVAVNIRWVARHGKGLLNSLVKEAL